MTPALQFALHGVGAEASLNLQDLGEVLFLQITGLHLHSQVGQMKVTSSPLLPSKLSHPGLRSVSLIFLSQYREHTSRGDPLELLELASGSNTSQLEGRASCSTKTMQSSATAFTCSYGIN